MKHEMDYYLYYTTKILGSIDLDPSEYLDCEDEDDVRSKLWNDILESIEIPGDYDLEYHEWEIPDSFWEEWRKLKNE